MAKYILVALSNCKEGTDAEFNEWYNEVHLPDVLRLKGHVSAVRYCATEDQLRPEVHYRYMAIYELDVDNVKEAMAALQGAAGTDKLPIGDTLDGDRTVVYYYQPIEHGNWRRA